MKYLAFLLVFASLGCANVTTMKINRMADGSLSINSGKDVSIGALNYTSKTGETLSIQRYTSNSNSAAIEAQAVREKQIIDGITNALQAGAALAAKGAK